MASPITIDKGVPLPEGRGKGHTIYPFAEMAIGDSFAVEMAGAERLRAAAAAWARRKGVKFSVRRYQGKMRCWRTE